MRAFIFSGWAITNAVQNVPVLVNMLAEALPTNNSLGFKPAHVTVLRFLMSSLDLTAEFMIPRLCPWFTQLYYCQRWRGLLMTHRVGRWPGAPHRAVT